jgi:phenylalanyl-tRNA synthetase beta chain
LIIGEVKTCEKHPNADKLTVTTVDIGTGEILPIVCGAPNVAAGQKLLLQQKEQCCISMIRKSK